MSQPDLLKRVVTVLEQAGIDYMVTGSIASSLQGEPRATHDINLVVEIAPTQVPDLIQAFPAKDYYVDAGAALEAIQTGGMFNLLELEEGDKVDFWVLTDQPFDVSRFARKYIEPVFGIDLKVSRPEDTILQKLKWVRATGGSEKSFIDALRVYEVQHGSLDLKYMEDWVAGARRPARGSAGHPCAVLRPAPGRRETVHVNRAATATRTRYTCNNARMVLRIGINIPTL